MEQDKKQLLAIELCQESQSTSAYLLAFSTQLPSIVWNHEVLFAWMFLLLNHLREK